LAVPQSTSGHCPVIGATGAVVAGGASGVEAPEAGGAGCYCAQLERFVIDECLLQRTLRRQALSGG
jgi:hypothetical protein